MTVVLPENIRISDNVPQDLAAHLSSKSSRSTAVLMDENTLEHCYPKVKEYLPEHSSILIKSGEEHKTLETCTKIWQHMTDAGFDRNGLLINLGGGVIGDMGGFCASTYKRGIAFINLPSTLLSQVDASIGGKLGVDFGPFKNHIGLFCEPERVMIYPDFLNTLDERELRSGYAEVVKHALISDREYWTKLASKGFKEQDWSAHIRHSTLAKYDVVSNDPKERGLRKILNFGHTIGHAIEGYYLFSPDHDKLLHGEAIAIGMICEAFLSWRKMNVSEVEVRSIADYLIQVYGKVSLDRVPLDDICTLMLHDKKNKGSSIKASLLESVGNCSFDNTISIDEAKAALRFYQEYEPQRLISGINT